MRSDTPLMYGINAYAFGSSGALVVRYLVKGAFLWSNLD